jgi:hypothetical protein
MLAAAAVGWAMSMASPPEQVHISLAGQHAQTGDSTGVAVMWYTDSAPVHPLVQFGTANSTQGLNLTAQATSHSYLAGHGYHHTAELLPLQPSTPYFYKVGDNGAWSDVQRFVSPPAAAAGQEFSVSIFGDMGYEGSTERPMIITVAGLKKHWSAVPTRRRLAQLQTDKEIDFVWHLGDIGYIDDSFAHDPLHFVYESAYNGYMNWLQPLSSAMPYMVAPGNHESECHIAQCQIHFEKYGDKLNNFTAFNARWHMPHTTSGGALNMWYSFNYGLMHFVSINSETDFPSAEERSHGDASDFPAGSFGAKGEYMRWLEEDLRKANASRGVRPWIIAGGHRPCCGDVPGVAQLFEKYGVVMYFAGHTHSYWRSKPTFSDMREQPDLPAIPRATHFSPAGTGRSATTYVTAGGAGCDEMTWVNKTSDQRRSAELGVPQMDALQDFDASGLCLRRRPGAPVASGSGNPKEVVRSGRLASGVLTVYNRTALRWRLLASTDGSILDEVYVTQPPL